MGYLLLLPLLLALPLGRREATRCRVPFWQAFGLSWLVGVTAGTLWLAGVMALVLATGAGNAGLWVVATPLAIPVGQLWWYRSRLRRGGASPSS